VTIGRVGATDEFFEAAREGRLTAKRCGACGRWTGPYSFRGITLVECPHCHERELTWKGVSGKATLVSWTVLPESSTVIEGAPLQVSGVVELAEGPWLPCAIDVPVEDLAAGLNLVASFATADSGQMVPVVRLTRGVGECQ
jgi:uncharacterized OB-fold protein